MDANKHERLKKIKNSCIFVLIGALKQGYYLTADESREIPDAKSASG